MKRFIRHTTACFGTAFIIGFIQAKNASADQIISDDLIIQSSLCVGTDCSNGEDFQADTIRLKENNLRIHFDDTSNAASFPSNDWSIVINDNTNGGRSYFAVQDRTAGFFPLLIEAGAGDNTLVVDSNNRVGIGTDAPTESLHVVGNALITGNLELGSSRTYKNNIRKLELDDALSSLMNLQPVRFYYKVAPEEESLGFIAEDVPDLVATNDRKSINPFDVIAVLTTVVQQQQETIENLKKRVENLENKK